MEIIYSCYDIATNEDELKNNITEVTKLGIKNVACFPSYIKCSKAVDPAVKTFCAIDYPFGLQDLKSRAASVEYAIKCGTDVVETVAPTFFLCNRKYDKFREDIKNISTLCSQANIELRYILEYRSFTYELLYKATQILLENGIDTIYASSGILLDDINDNLIAIAMITKKVPQIKILTTGNVWNSSQVSNIKKANIFGAKVNSVNAVNLLCQN